MVSSFLSDSSNETLGITPSNWVHVEAERWQSPQPPGRNRPNGGADLTPCTNAAPLKHLLGNQNAFAPRRSACRLGPCAARISSGMERENRLHELGVAQAGQRPDAAMTGMLNSLMRSRKFSSRRRSKTGWVMAYSAPPRFVLNRRSSFSMQARLDWRDTDGEVVLARWRWLNVET